MEGKPCVVAIVDDDPSVGTALRRLLRSLGHEAYAFTSGHAVLFGMGPTQPTHFILDFHMPPPSGAFLVARVHARWPEARIVVMSGLVMDGAADACRSAGASLLLRKPLLSEDLERFLASTPDRAE